MFMATATIMILSVRQRRRKCFHNKAFFSASKNNFLTPPGKPQNSMVLPAPILMECSTISIFTRRNTKPNGNFNIGMDLVYSFLNLG